MLTFVISCVIVAALLLVGVCLAIRHATRHDEPWLDAMHNPKGKQ